MGAAWTSTASAAGELHGAANGDGDASGSSSKSSTADSDSSSVEADDSRDGEEELDVGSTYSMGHRSSSANASPWEQITQPVLAMVRRATSGERRMGTTASNSFGMSLASTDASSGSLVTLSFSLQPTAELRAVPVRLLLADFGRIWLSSKSGSRSKAHLSAGGKKPWFVTEEYDVFVSHNWGASRLEKHKAMLLVFNGRAALIWGILCGPLMGCLEVFFNFPEVTDWVDIMVLQGRTYTTRFRWWAEIVGFVTTVSIILFWHQTEGVCRRRQALFLDKLSIDQDNPRMRIAGIRSLPGFLSFTDTLLVIWSKDYLSRLWCVLELATWVHLKKKNMFFLPTMTPKIVFGYFLYMLFAGLASSVYQHYGLSRGRMLAFLWGPIFIACITAQWLLRDLMKQRLALDHQLKTFDCRQARCSVEEDREMILEQIKRWFGNRGGGASTPAAPVHQTHTGASTPAAPVHQTHTSTSSVADATSELSHARTGTEINTAEVAHRYFNKVVRTSVYEQLHKVSGNAASLRYEWVLLACLPTWFRWCDITASAVEGELPTDSIVNVFVHGMCLTFCYAPLILQVFLWFTVWMASKSLGAVAESVRFFAVCVFLCVLNFAVELLANTVQTVNSWFVTIAVDAVLVLVTVVIYSSKARWYIHRVCVPTCLDDCPE